MAPYRTLGSLGLRFRALAGGHIELVLELPLHVAPAIAQMAPNSNGRRTLKTRQPKAHPVGEAEVTREMKDYGVTRGVVEHWHRRAMDAPEDVAAVVRAAVGEARPSSRPSRDQVKLAAGELVEWVSDRQAVFTQRGLFAHVSSLFPDGVNPRDLVNNTRSAPSPTPRHRRTLRRSHDTLRCPRVSRCVNRERNPMRPTASTR